MQRALLQIIPSSIIFCLSSLLLKLACAMFHVVRDLISSRDWINKWVYGYNVLESSIPGNSRELLKVASYLRRLTSVGISGTRERAVRLMVGQCLSYYINAPRLSSKWQLCIWSLYLHTGGIFLTSICHPCPKQGFPTFAPSPPEFTFEGREDKKSHYFTKLDNFLLELNLVM